MLHYTYLTNGGGSLSQFEEMMWLPTGSLAGAYHTAAMRATR
jgi:hypothetical protein